MSELDTAVADRIAAHRPEHAPPFADLVARRRRQRRTRAGAGIAGAAAVGTAAVLAVPATLGDPAGRAPGPAIAAPGSGVSPGRPGDPGRPARTSAPGTGQAAGPADQAAWARWQRLGAADYTIRLSRHCFCPASADLLVRVRGGRAVLPPGRQAYEYKSVADLFDLIFSADYDRFTVSYDPTYGFPVRLEVDAMRAAIDDEFTYVVTDYRPGA